MGTPHNTAKKGDIAKVVLMPGDPLRAKYLAENYLEDAVCFNEVRGMYGYTGTYEGKRISVMGSGMGIPSIGIYSYELFAFYDVEAIIRIGSTGAINKDLGLGDIVIAQGSSTNSAFAEQYKLPGTFAPLADYELLEKSVSVARELGLKFKVGNILSNDVFYTIDPEDNDRWERMGILGAEMESAALYMNATYLGKRALGMFTVSDLIFDETQSMSAEARQTSLTDMMEVALKTAKDFA